MDKNNYVHTEYGLGKPKKALGQNFLKSTLALKKIIEVGEISKRDIILEIGPGKGILTEKLLEKTNCVIAIEKDFYLFQLLQKKFKKEIQNKQLILIVGDIIQFKIKNYLSSLIPQKQTNKLQNYKIIANIPYNITGAILKKFLTEEKQPERMILMVQKDVARRIVARDKKESILSVSIKAYGEPRIIMKVPARYFSPAPKVDSTVIAIKNISRKIFTKNNINEKEFWQIVRAGFAHKRKKLSSNLKMFQKYEENSFIKTLKNKRAEELTLTDWINLVKTIYI